MKRHVRVRKVADGFDQGAGFVCHAPLLAPSVYCVKYINAERIVAWLRTAEFNTNTNYGAVLANRI
jgi:hypothetical protein